MDPTSADLVKRLLQCADDVFGCRAEVRSLARQAAERITALEGRSSQERRTAINPAIKSEIAKLKETIKIMDR
jgi:hypothetical protein